MPITETQKSVLRTYFNNDMVGVGKKYAAQIDVVVAETGLTERQVKVRISNLTSIETLDGKTINVTNGNLRKLFRMCANFAQP